MKNYICTIAKRKSDISWIGMKHREYCFSAVDVKQQNGTIKPIISCIVQCTKRHLVVLSGITSNESSFDKMQQSM